MKKFAEQMMQVYLVMALAMGGILLGLAGFGLGVYTFNHVNDGFKVEGFK